MRCFPSLSDHQQSFYTFFLRETFYLNLIIMSDFTGPGKYKIWSRHSDKVLNIRGGDEEGTRVGIW